MTEKEIQSLFAENPFMQAKEILIDRINAAGIETTGNETAFELKSLALGNSVSMTHTNPQSISVVHGSGEEMNECKSASQGGGMPLFEQGQGGTQKNLEQSKEPPESSSDTSESAKEEPEEKEETEEPEINQENQPKRKRGRRKKEPSPEEMIAEQEMEAQRKKEEAQRLLEESRIAEERAKAIKEEQERKRKEEEEKERKKYSGKHSQTDEVVRRLKALGKAFLVGPAGTGKSTLAMCACSELFSIPREEVAKSDKFAQISFSPDTVSADMLGFTDVNGVFHETDIVKVFRDGGLILFDEMDDADASLLVKLNTMLANGVLPTPNGVVTQNPQTYIVGTANTYGKGGNSMYVGRSRLDAATLDRWKMATINVEYDCELEKHILSSLPEKEAFEIETAKNNIREMIEKNRWKQICSTRFVIDAMKMSKAGYGINKIIDTFLLDWDDNTRRTVLDVVRKAIKKEA